MNTRTQFINTTGALLLLLLSLPPAANAAFINNGDGTVTDTVTGLMWDQCSQGQSGGACATGTATTMTWSAALTAVDSAINANYKGHADWRLPNKNELESLVDIDIADATVPAVDLTAFPATPGARYWSSTTYMPNTAGVWIVDFSVGVISADIKTTNYAVRLVRSLQ